MMNSQVSISYTKKDQITYKSAKAKMKVHDGM